MAVRIVTAPAAVLQLAEVKAHLREDGSDEDGLIQALINTACAHVSGPNGVIGRSIGPQTLELTGTPCNGLINLPLPPFISLVSAHYRDTAGEEIEMEVSDFQVRAGAHGTVDLYLATWPSAAIRADAYRVRYTAGLSTTDPEFQPIRTAMLLLIGHWFKNREATGRVADTSSIPFAVNALLSPLHVWSV